MKTIAKDGKPFDVEDALVLNPGEIEVIQFLTPSGKRRRMAVLVGEDYVEKAEKLILSAEILNNKQVALYARGINESKEKDKIMLAINGPGINNTIIILKKLIDTFVIQHLS